MKKPNICVLFMGGTIGMVRDAKTGALSPSEDLGNILKNVPFLSDYADIAFERLENIDSSNMFSKHWELLAKRIYELYEQYDGFVVTQGTDTMAYSASAISFALQNLSKPIIFTGSLIPLSEIGSDGTNNLAYACLTATKDIAEVIITFGNKILRANRSKKYREVYANVFHSPNYSLLGEVSHHIRLFDHHKRRSNSKLKFYPGFNDNIVVVKLTPGLNPDYLKGLMDDHIDGIIIEAFGPGNIPFLNEAFVQLLQWGKNQKIPIIICSQMEHGVTDFHAYEAGYKAKEAGVISGGDMTIEACSTKLMHCLAREKSLSKIRELMETNMVGELGKVG